ncbi:major urinary protein 20-like isoform X1 [Notamacropus eugenii]|uniref:major urinary protein 20-like isoform X1 n=1 Tax=Notamacropus eugenii TaxID=9315 RepID=UPI003B679899
MKLLLLTMGLCVASAFASDSWVSEYPDFKPEQINGHWFSIAVVSDRRKETMPDGSNRFQIYSFQARENGDIHAITYINWNDVCQQANITLTETKTPGQYKVNRLEDNYFLMEDTDYKNFLIVYCQIGRSNRVWELFGRSKYIPRLYKMKFETKVMSHGFQKEDVSYFSEKERCPKEVIRLSSDVRNNILQIVAREGKA